MTDEQDDENDGSCDDCGDWSDVDLKSGEKVCQTCLLVRYENIVGFVESIAKATPQESQNIVAMLKTATGGTA